MNQSIDRRDFSRISAIAGGVTLSAFGFQGCAHTSVRLSETKPEYDIFHHFKPVTHLSRLKVSDLSSLSEAKDGKTQWLLQAIATIFQGLVNREEPRIYLDYGRSSVDWIANYHNEGYTFTVEDVPDFPALLDAYGDILQGYIVYDPDMLHSINIAQTWATLESWLVIGPEQEPLAKKCGLTKREDLQGRWNHRMEGYRWAVDHLLPHCSRHILGAQCVHYPHHPSGDATIRDFLVCHNAFTFDLSAAFRQREEYRLFTKICQATEFPAGIWGWHCSRCHEHWAVARAARENMYTICALLGENYTVHGGIRPKPSTTLKQKPSPRKNCIAQNNKIYVAFMMTDGDALWAMSSLQRGNWNSDQRGTVPNAWGFLPLMADIAPAMYAYFVKYMQPFDCMVAGPSGAGYTYPHMHDDPARFLRYSKHYMQRCGLDIVYLTNWNDDTNWQEVELPWFNPLLFSEMDNCLGYVHGMGESAFEPHYNFADKPYIFCGEGIHRNDKDDVATMRDFIEANPNRPLFIYCLVNVAVEMSRLENIVNNLKGYDIEYVRLDDFIKLVKDAYACGLITEDLYPNREGNARILTAEAPTQWAGTQRGIQKLAPVICASTLQEALREINTDAVGLAQNETITEDELPDVLAFALCEAMFSLIKNTLNYKGIYVNLREEAVEKFVRLNHDWEGGDSVRRLWELWRNWDRSHSNWEEVRAIGLEFLKVADRTGNLFAA